MRRGPSRFLRSEGGASAVEFAMVAPVFLLMVFGTIEFGRLFWVRHALHETAIATARCMGIPQRECVVNDVYDPVEALSFARSTARGWFVRLDAGSVQIDRQATCLGVGGFSSVALTYEFKTVVPDLLLSLAGGPRLEASACYPNHTG